MKNGPYELVKAPVDYPGKTYRGRRRYVYEHHLVWWENTGQIVPDGFQIHHKNGKKRDNRFDNLVMMSIVEHAEHHGAEQIKEMVLVKCEFCGKEFERSLRVVKQNDKRVNKNGKKPRRFCSQSHQMKQFWKEKHSSVAQSGK